MNDGGDAVEGFREGRGIKDVPSIGTTPGGRVFPGLTSAHGTRSQPPRVAGRRRDPTRPVPPVTKSVLLFSSIDLFILPLWVGMNATFTRLSSFGTTWYRYQKSEVKIDA